MTAAKIILQATGLKSIYLTSNPEINLFKCIYKRHVNFARILHKEQFEPEFKFDSTVVCRIPKTKGDYISNMTLEVNIGAIHPYINNNIYHDNGNINCACINCLNNKYKEKPVFGFINSLGNALIKEARFKIGNMTMTRMSGEAMEIISDLSQTYEKKVIYNEMVGRVEPCSFTADKFAKSMKLLIPLSFSLCTSVSNSFPILKLLNTSQEVDIEIDVRKFNECWVTNIPNKFPMNTPNISASLIVNNYYLDQAERTELHKESYVMNHDYYLIEDIKEISCPIDSNTNICDVNLDQVNIPIKEIIWVVQRCDVLASPIEFNIPNDISGYPFGNDLFNYSVNLNRRVNLVQDTFETAQILFNKTEVTPELPAMYYRLAEQYYKHTKGSNNYIYTYSFAERPEEMQPSGITQFAYIKNKILRIKGINSSTQKCMLGKIIKVFAVGYNAIQFKNGIAGITYM